MSCNDCATAETVATIRRGDDFSAVIILKQCGKQFEIVDSDLVTYELLDRSKAVVIASTSSLKNDSGADWPRSVVSINYDDAVTTAIPATVTSGYLRIRIDSSGVKTSADIPVNVI